MKKLLLLFVIFTLMVSCSSSSTDDEDLIVGSWNLFSFNGTEVSTCEQQSYIIFFANSTATGEDYQLNASNECERVGVNETVQWVNEGNNVYIIRPGTNAITWNVTFSNGNNTMNITNQGVVYTRN